MKGIRSIKTHCFQNFNDSTKSVNSPEFLAALKWERVLRMSRLERRTHDCEVGRTFRVCTVNIGTLKGKGREIADMLRRRKADICSVQEVRYKGKKTMSFGKGDDEYKLLYSGDEDGSNGVGIFTYQEQTESVIEVVRYSDRLMKIQMVLGRRFFHIYFF